MYDEEIIHVKDILSPNGKFLSYNDILGKRVKINFLDYYSLLRTIPKNWLDKINDNVRQKNRFLIK